MTPEGLAALIGRGPLLLDFDGPVCGIFSGLPAPEVAAGLVNVLHGAGIDVPAVVASASDPLVVLRWTGEVCGPDPTRLVDDALRDLELRAVGMAAPTPFGHEVVIAARGAGLPVAVVSNNSAPAVSAYLAKHGLAQHVSPVVGRPYGRPDRMKPNPKPIFDAVGALGAKSVDAVLIGDSLSDIEGARAAGVKVIGYANRADKVAAFRHADAVIETMEVVCDALAGRLDPA